MTVLGKCIGKCFGPRILSTFQNLSPLVTELIAQACDWARNLLKQRRSCVEGAVRDGFF